MTDTQLHEPPLGLNEEIDTDAPVAAVSYKRSMRERAAALALPTIFVAIVVVFTVLRPETFYTTANLKTILLTQSVPAIFAIALLLPLVVGELDLSIGATLGVGLIVVAGAPGALGLWGSGALGLWGSRPYQVSSSRWWRPPLSGC